MQGNYISQSTCCIDLNLISEITNLCCDFITDISIDFFYQVSFLRPYNAFSILALRPVSFLSNEELNSFGEGEIDTQCKFYGERRTVEWSDEEGSHRNSSEAVISAEET